MRRFIPYLVIVIAAVACACLLASVAGKGDPSRIDERFRVPADLPKVCRPGDHHYLMHTVDNVELFQCYAPGKWMRVFPNGVAR